MNKKNREKLGAGAMPVSEVIDELRNFDGLQLDSAASIDSDEERYFIRVSRSMCTLSDVIEKLKSLEPGAQSYASYDDSTVYILVEK